MQSVTFPATSSKCGTACSSLTRMQLHLYVFVCDDEMNQTAMRPLQLLGAYSGSDTMERVDGADSD